MKSERFHKRSLIFIQVEATVGRFDDTNNHSDKRRL